MGKNNLWVKDIKSVIKAETAHLSEQLKGHTP